MKGINLYKVNAIMIALIPILRIYTVSVLVLSDILCLLLIFVNLLVGVKSHGNSNPDRRLCISVLIIGLLGAIVNSSAPWFNLSSYINNQIIVIPLLTLVVLVRRVDYNVLAKTLMFLGILASAICIIQRLQYIATGDYYRNVYLPGFEMVRDIDTISRITRPCAFFTEPAHLSIFLLPIFYLAAMLKKYLYAIFIAIAILSSGSTTGFLILGTLVLVVAASFKMKFTNIVGIIILLVAVYIVIMMISPDIFLENFKKLESTDVEENSRLLGGFQYIKYMNEGQLLFGTGIHQMQFVTKQFGVESPDYAFALLYMFQSYGFFGLLSLLIYLFKIYKSYHNYVGFFIILMGVLLSDQVIFNGNFVYLASLVICSNQIINT